MKMFEAGDKVEVRVFNELTQESEWVPATVNHRIEKGNVVAYDVDIVFTEESAIVYQGGEGNEIR